MRSLKHARQEMFRIVHPHAITTVKLGGKVVPQDVLNSIWGFFILYLAIFVVSAMVMASLGLDMISAFSSVAACIFNIGYRIVCLDLQDPARYESRLARCLVGSGHNHAADDHRRFYFWLVPDLQSG